MATTVSQIETLPSEPQQAALNPGKGQSLPLQDLSPPGRTLTDLNEPEPRHVVNVQETWHNPRINTWRLAGVFFAFINFGMNDASYGACIPYVSKQTFFMEEVDPADLGTLSD